MDACKGLAGIWVSKKGDIHTNRNTHAEWAKEYVDKTPSLSRLYNTSTYKEHENIDWGPESNSYAAFLMNIGWIWVTSTLAFKVYSMSSPTQKTWDAALSVTIECVVSGKRSLDDDFWILDNNGRERMFTIEDIVGRYASKSVSDKMWESLSARLAHNPIRNVVREAIAPAIPAAAASMVGGMAMRFLIKTVIKKVLMRWVAKKMTKEVGKKVVKEVGKKTVKEVGKKASKGILRKVLLNTKIMSKSLRKKAAQGKLTDKQISGIADAIEEKVGPKVQDAFYAGMVGVAVKTKDLSKDEGEAFKKKDKDTIMKKAKKAGIKVTKKSKPKKEKSGRGKAPEDEDEKSKSSGKPPKGYKKVPGSKKGTYRREKKDGGYDYWEPSEKV